MSAKMKMGLWMRTAVLAVLLSISAVTIGGCGTIGHHKTSDLHALPFNAAADRTYAAPVDAVSQAALFAMEQSGLEKVEEHQNESGTWYATGEIGYSWRSNGQFVRVSVRPGESTDSPRTEVVYSSLRRYEVNVTEDLTIIQEKVLTFMDQYIESM